MNIFILTDNLWWLKKAKEIFNETPYELDIYCSPIGEKMFFEYIQRGDIKTIDVKSNADFLISNYDIGFSCHCKQIFPKTLVNNLRCINIHPGFNPENRGWYPQVFSIINKKTAGATIHLMDQEVDHGSILFQKSTEIMPWDTSKTVYDRVLLIEAELLSENLKSIIEGEAVPQEMSSEGNYNSVSDFHKLCEIDLDKQLTMREAIDYLRAMTHPPYKNAYFFSEQGEKVLVSLNIEKI